MAQYRLFGAETSPYSLKVRAFLRYKNVEFEWIGRSRHSEEEFQAAARAPTVPLLISPNRPASQDSTAMLSALEADHPEPSAVPDEPAAATLALILEDFADEWVNKCMFQQRWGQKPDCEEAALRVLVQLNGGKRPRAYKKATQQIAARMLDRLPLVGAEPQNAETLEVALHALSRRLDAHLREHLYLFGGRPSVADFALAAQYQQLLLDPTPSAWLKEHAPFIVTWCDTMDNPKAGGPFESLDALRDTLAPILAEDLAKTYLPWAAANKASASRQKKHFSVTLPEGAFEQSTQAYAAKSFDAVVRAVTANGEDPQLAVFLGETHCAEFFPDATARFMKKKEREADEIVVEEVQDAEPETNGSES